MMATVIASGKNIDQGVLGPLAAFALYAASLNFAATPAMALPNYDGLWSVLIVTEKGDCDRGYRYPIRITLGTLSNGGDTCVHHRGQSRPDRSHPSNSKLRQCKREWPRAAYRQCGQRVMEQQFLLGHVDGQASRLVKREYLKADLCEPNCTHWMLLRETSMRSNRNCIIFRGSQGRSYILRS